MFANGGLAAQKIQEDSYALDYTHYNVRIKSGWNDFVKTVCDLVYDRHG